MLNLSACQGAQNVPCCCAKNLLTGPAIALQEKLNVKTVDEELTSDPALLKQVDEEISKGSYY